MESRHILSILKRIKERLHNLQIQRKHIPNANKPLFPFASSIDLLNKISDEEAYLLREASKLKDRLFVNSSAKGKELSSEEVDTLLYLEM